MPPGGRTEFSQALRRHEAGGRLKAAFDACNQDWRLDRYDRTTLTRWLEGSVPNREDFVQRLAAELDDPGIIRAWETDREARSSDTRSIITRYRHLSTDDRRLVRKAILDEIGHEEVRSSYSIRMDLFDSKDPGFYQVTLSVNWSGPLVSGAEVIFVAEEDALADAYLNERCIFRDVVHLDPDHFDRAFGPGGEHLPHLTYSPIIDGVQKPSTDCQPTVTRPGVIAFDTEEQKQAEIRLRASFPLTHEIPFRVVLFGHYQIKGPARLTFVTRSQNAGPPRALTFLGNPRSWAPITGVGNDELEVAILENQSVDGSGTGVIFFWPQPLAS
jgi:hypothetical protein